MIMGTKYSDHKLMAWFSPAYPIGSYSYSHGLEHAIDSQIVTEKESFFCWLKQILNFGTGRNDAILLSQAYQTGKKDLIKLGQIAEALAETKERYFETLQQGEAFSKVTSSVCNISIPKLPLPVAVGYAAQLEKICLEKVLTFYLHAFSANLISAAIRFLPLGQTDGQVLLFKLFRDFKKLAVETKNLGLDDLGSSCFLNDIGNMKHETMKTRIFRS